MTDLAELDQRIACLEKRTQFIRTWMFYASIFVAGLIFGPAISAALRAIGLWHD